MNFYQHWLRQDYGYTGLGSFHQGLMELYTKADNSNREKLDKAFPEYFIEIKDGTEVDHPNYGKGKVIGWVQGSYWRVEFFDDIVDFSPNKLLPYCLNSNE